MKERMFILAEVRDCHSPLPEITESEFCRRFDKALLKRMKESTPTRELLSIFLHGDVEKGEEPPDGLFHGPGLAAFSYRLIDFHLRILLPLHACPHSHPDVYFLFLIDEILRSTTCDRAQFCKDFYGADEEGRVLCVQVART